jgi:ABC-2 type transport system permease protein
MTTLHLGTFLWLRWRLFVNQMKRGGVANSIILGILAVSVCVALVASFVGAVAGGVFLLPLAPANVQLLVWDVIIVLFIFAWMIGLLNELQRSEALTLEKFLHLPVSLAGVFVLNYLSSFMSLTLMFAAPILFGLTLGSVIGIGPAMLPQLFNVAAFLFAVTALSYQFQGWLASLMANKRRRRTIVVVVSVLFLVMFQVPNLINLYRPWEIGAQAEYDQQLETLKQAHANKKIDDEEYRKQERKLDREFHNKSAETAKNLWENVQDYAWYANALVPPGWLAIGGATAAEGNVLPALLAAFAYGGIGTLSLWRAYRTILRLYTGEFTSNKPPAVTAAPATKTRPAAAPSTFLSRSIPWLPEQATIIALATLRGLLRAPEAKMILLSPVIMLVVFSGIFLRGGMKDAPPIALPFIATGAMALIFFSMMQIMGNQFGFDRAGFRIFVLSPAPRREILMGKNLAMLPILFTLFLPILIILQIFLRLRIDQFLAIPGQFVSMFLLYSMLTNTISILAPVPVAAGSLKPAKPKGLIILAHIFFMMFTPAFLSPAVLPQVIEAILASAGFAEGWPIGMVLTYLELAAITALYLVVVSWQGGWLESRELAILDIVTSKAE